MNRAVAMQQPQNAVQLLTTSTGGVGELANFLMGASYVVVAGVIYKHRKTKKTALIACIAASVVMGIAAALANSCRWSRTICRRISLLSPLRTVRGSLSQADL